MTKENQESKSSTPGPSGIVSRKMLITVAFVAVLGTGGYYILKARHHGVVSVGIFTPDAEAVEIVSLKVEGMTCGGCAPVVTKALSDVPGVEAAEVDFKIGKARVQVRKGTPKAKLIEAVQGAGFSAS